MDSPTQLSAVPEAIEPDGKRTTDRPAGRGDDGPGLLPYAAVALAAVGALGVAAGTLGAVARSAADGTRIPAVGAAAVVTVVLALAVPVVAAVLTARRSPAGAALLAGAGVVSAGLCVMDVQLWTGPIDANRLELFRPLTAGGIEAGPGAVLVLAGHVCAVVAGIIGLVAVHRASHADGYGSSPDPDAVGRPVGSRVGAGLVAVVLAAAGALAAALFARPFTSSDPVLVVRAAIAADAPTAIGSAVVAIAVLIAVAAALASVDVAVAAGVVGGAALAALGPTGSRLAAGLVDDRLSPGAGTVWGVLGAALLAAGAAAIPAVAGRRERRAVARVAASAETPADARGTGATARDRMQRWHAAAGIAGIVSGALASVGALLPALSVPAGLPEPSIPATRMVLVAGVLLAITGVWLLMSEFSVLFRPALAIMWVAVVAAAADVAQTALTAVQIPGVTLGVGSALVTGAVVAAVGAGVLAGIAGAAERDDIDTSEPNDPPQRVLVVGAAAAVATVLGYALPLYRGSDGTAAALGRLPWGWDAWGQVLSVVAIVVAVLVAMGARAQRGAVLLVGAAVVVALHVLSWPLSAGRLTDPVVAAGVAPAILAVVLLAVSAALVGRRDRR
ncbi:hypothetical protein EGT67_06070 [Prescottella agglutinans]|uniref:Uncharacterized protein n=1 Tax=Prescottella agglutinans TaxID=1644129 RepID=A0A438BIU3_9NOCA|nr:hypothetical protein [Prescottella agglutinans]RVW10711.1 hypothetical protein EGT67_06070 [Prescottella agglutinans]